MQITVGEFKAIVIKAVIDAAPNAIVAKDYANDDFFWQATHLENIFQELEIESLGRILFLTELEEKTSINVADATAFFTINAQKTIDELANYLKELSSVDQC